MAVSQYFNHSNNVNEQRLVEDIIVESIKIMGFDCYYLPNENDAARDLLYGEDPLRTFSNAFPLEMYLSDTLEYIGDKEMFGKFGLEIKNQIRVIVSKRSFASRVPQNLFTRPREGDLVYIPVLNQTGELFEIKFTNQTKDFSMLGRKVPYFYELEMERFKFSQERFSTGVAEIDQAATDSAYTIHLTTGAGTGKYKLKELVFQSHDGTYANANTVATIQEWIPSSNTLSVTNIAGEFLDGVPAIGVESGASFIISTYDPLFNPAKLERYDNLYIKTQGDIVKNTDEPNSFGTL